jgi:hypothetical protein
MLPEFLLSTAEKRGVPFLSDCAIVRALSISMVFSSLNRGRVWFVTPSAGASVALLFILVLFISNVEIWRPSTFFGRYSDDALYFSTAQALAQHQGYVLPSFPGRPLRPQVPILYPLLLSGVWKLDPKFPENLVWAIRLTEGFGCVVLLCAFFLFRCIAGMGRIPSLILTALCAFHPVLLRLSGLTLSDVPFAAMFLLTLLIANFAVSPRRSWALPAALGIAAALSASLRTLGYAAVMGILAYILHRREYRRALAYSLAAGITISSSLFLAAHYTPSAAREVSVPVNSTGSQWERLVVFHTEYIRFHWLLGIPTVAAFFSMLKENCLQLVSSPGPFLAGAFDRRSWLLTAGMSAIVLSGVVRQLRRPEWRALAFMTIPYVLIIIVWPYPIMERFLFPFLPIFLVAMVLESKRLLSLAISNLRAPASSANRLLAAGICTILIGYTAFAGRNYLFRDRQQLLESEHAQAKSLEEKKEVYSWIRGHTPAEAKIVAYEDILLFLYSRRQALRPIALLPAAAYSKRPGSDSPDMAGDLAHLCDAPRDAGATYWLVTQEDFSLDAEPEKTASRQNEIAAVLPLVFRSSGGFARLYDSSCLQDASREDCQKARAVLFPTNP